MSRILILTRKVIRLGNAFCISIPKSWFKRNNISPEKVESLLLVIGEDIRIVNPKRVNEIYEKVNQLIGEDLLEKAEVRKLSSL